MFWVNFIWSQTWNENGGCCRNCSKYHKLKHGLGSLRTMCFYLSAFPCTHFCILFSDRILIWKLVCSCSCGWSCSLISTAKQNGIFISRSMTRSAPLVKSSSNLVLSVSNCITVSIIPQGALWALLQKGQGCSCLTMTSPCPCHCYRGERGPEEGLVPLPGEGQQGRALQALPHWARPPSEHSQPLLTKTALSCNFLEAETLFKVYSIFFKARHAQTELFLLC